MIKPMFSVLLLSAVALAADPEPIRLYPGAAPSSESWKYEEELTTSNTGEVTNIRNVVVPTLTPYLPEKSRATGTAVIVCPGGGFNQLVVGKEGTEIARWLNHVGIAAFILKYRIARTGDADSQDPKMMRERQIAVRPLALADAQQAMRILRRRAAEFGIAKDRIGIMGFSAGGYVTNDLAMHHDAETRPDFAAPIYGGVPPEVTVPADAPPLFLVHADDDDRVPPLNTSIRLYTAWKAANKPVELHIYAKGSHGFALRRNELPVNNWPERLREWLESEGLLKATAPASSGAY